MLFGIDVSHHQAPSAIDWRKLAFTHHFAYVRATYGVRPDATAAAHVECARAVGMRVGLYHFFRAGQSPTDQLTAFERAAQLLGMGDGWLLPALDVERNEKFDGAFTRERYSEQCRGIAESWQQLHGGAVVYTNPGDWLALGSPEWLRAHKLWIAHWGVAQPTTPFGMPWAIWQTRVAPLPGVYAKDIDQNAALELPLVSALASAADWDEEDDTKVTRAILKTGAQRLRQAKQEFLSAVELPSDREAEMRDRDRSVRESDPDA